jgi:hypothetical protein
MIKRIKNILQFSLFFFVSLIAEEKNNNYYKYISLNEQSLLNKLNSIPIHQDFITRNNNKTVIIDLPDINGKSISYNLIETPVLPLNIANKYPNIRTFTGNSIKNPSEKITITKSKNNLSITLHFSESTIKLKKDVKNQRYYMAENKSEYEPLLNNCNLLKNENSLLKHNQQEDFDNDLEYSIGDSLYVYRIGMILSSEANAIIADGTIEGGLTWISDMVNRCNIVWVRDLGSKLILTEKADLLICTDNNKGYFPSPPFDNPTHYLLQYIEPMLNDIVGVNNYEYGHLVTPGVGGGWAALSSKRGVSDPNYEVIIHEIGHQLGSHHNLVNEGAEHAWSIGGTIMGNRSNTFANSENIFSGDQYSSHTIDVAISRQRNLINSFAGGWYHEASGNSVPMITEMPNENLSIPIGTPFILKGKAEDNDGDELTYTWEQNDRAKISFDIPDFPDDSGPLFVSVFPNKLGSERTFPNMKDLLNNNFKYKEQLPFSSRELNFRFIVRDNNLISGGYNYKNLKLFSDENSGPFKVKTANYQEIYSAGNELLVEWDIANTNLSPVNCRKVKILLSINDGESFEFILAENTENDGSELVSLPNIVSKNCRIMVQAEDNIFFDINDIPFELHDPQIPALFITIDNYEIKILDENSLSVLLSSRALGSLTDSLRISVISKPVYINHHFENNDTVLVVQSTSESKLYFTNLVKLSKGRHLIKIRFEAQGIIEEQEIILLKTSEIYNSPGYCGKIEKIKNQNIVIPKFNIKTNDFSFMAWIKPEGLQDQYSAIFCLESDKTVALNFRENGELGYHWEGGSWSWSSGLFVDEGQWNHVALVAKQNSISIYLNGNQVVHSIDAEIIDFNNFIRLGSYKNWSNRFYNGLIDEVSFWNRSLNQDEINSFHGTLKGNEEGLLAYYQFDQQNLSDAIGDFNGSSINGKIEYLTSTGPFGESEYSRKSEKEGIIDFSEIGLTVNYYTQNGSEVNISRITTKPNYYKGISAEDQPLDHQYWVYHRYSQQGIYLGDITFSVEDLISSNAYNLPEDYSIYNRPSGSDSEWKQLKVASEIDKINNSLKFDGLFATGQFLIAKRKESVVKVEDKDEIPIELKLEQNYPNPFNPSTTIKFGIPNTSKVSIVIYDILGNRIKNLANQIYSAGFHNILWNGNNEADESVSSGIYIYQIISNSFIETKKMILIR